MGAVWLLLKYLLASPVGAFRTLSLLTSSLSSLWVVSPCSDLFSAPGTALACVSPGPWITVQGEAPPSALCLVVCRGPSELVHVLSGHCYSRSWLQSLPKGSWVWRLGSGLLLGFRCRCPAVRQASLITSFSTNTKWSPLCFFLSLLLLYSLSQ